MAKHKKCIIKLDGQTTGATMRYEGDVLVSQTLHKEEYSKESHTHSSKLLKHLIRAINNRTRERNYFCFCMLLAQGVISESDFDREIDNNEDDYVINTNVDMLPQDIKALLEIAPQIKGLDSVDDLQDTFSINPSSTMYAIILSDDEYEGGGTDFTGL